MKIIFSLLFTLLYFSAIAQHDSTIRITKEYFNKPLKEVLQELETEHSIKIFYKKEWINDIKITASFSNTPLNQVLDRLIRIQKLDYILYNPNYIVILNDEKKTINLRKDSINSPPDKNLSANSSKESAYKLKGFVKDKTGKIVPGATISIKELKTGTISDENGFFELVVPKGTYNLTTSYLGYKTESSKIEIRSDLNDNIELHEDESYLSEVQILGKAADNNVSGIEMSSTTLTIATVRKMPVFMGETDVVRSILLIPGVTTMGEGSSGFFVRGGSVDQNLILMDDATIYNSSHLFGMFSVFNPDAVKDITLYRGGIPPKYGGRVSSVLDVKLKDPSAKKITGKGGIGIATSRLSLEGPIIKEKLFFSLSARGAYADWLFKLTPSQSLKNTRANFYDLNLKLEYLFNKNNTFSLSSYAGKDYMKLGADSISNFGVSASSTVFNYGNKFMTLKWGHYFTHNLNMTVTGITSAYQSKIINPEGGNAFVLGTGVNNRTGQINFDYSRNNQHKFNFGISATEYIVSPGSLNPIGISNVVSKDLQKENGLEIAYYLNHEYKITPALTLSYGLRYSTFNRFGTSEMYKYQDNVSKDVSSITDTVHYKGNQSIKTYGGIEPRASLKFSLNEKSSLKLSYNRTRQYIQLISNTTTSIPTDRWKLSDTYLKPQIADQVALGYFKNIFSNAVEISSEVYYKNIQNAIDYKNGATLLLNNAIETAVLQGHGKSAGIELMVRKNSGKITGWTSYTYSRSFIQIDGPYPEDKVNSGKWYPANYDKPHTVNTVFSYQTSRRVNFSSNFTYSTGRPITYPSSKYNINGISVLNYETRNQQRIPDYHRLDVSMTIDGNHKKNKKWEGSWSFSIYNVYGRKNAYSVFFKSTGYTNNAYKLSILGSAFPSITYNFKF